MAEDCIFCKIIEGEVPAYKLYEDELVVSFLDIFPIHPGHALVVPKKHTVDIFDTDEETIKQMMAVAKKLALPVMNGTKAQGINIGMNNKPAAGQEVFHAHMHIIPRYSDDGLKTWSKNLFKDDKHKQELYEVIKKAL
ncbi:HIT family protein [Candidatus Woesearchaeota archaeon]|nr:HIT family protein [Candidatus Woesearchaeota archaeon]